MTAALRPSGGPPYWSPGEVVTWEYVNPHGNPGQLAPVRVVDDADCFVAWLAPGTPILHPGYPDGSDLRSTPTAQMFAGRWVLQARTWTGAGVLRIAPTQRPWSMWVFWRDGWELSCWCVILETPHARARDRVVTQDHVLDLRVRPDRSIELKDELELEAAIASGWFDAAYGARVRSDAAAARELVRRWESPFRDGWEN